mmetsp:Transcript_32783/g.83235  ORF Transcript_32783/g.83235 Transcript_32783/m.83235 type:complete len:93 (+) Transcript_32783:188-466(+)
MSSQVCGGLAGGSCSVRPRPPFAEDSAPRAEEGSNRSFDSSLGSKISGSSEKSEPKISKFCIEDDCAKPRVEKEGSEKSSSEALMEEELDPA